MKFTENEMVFFDSITNGDSVFGIPLRFRIKEEKEKEIANTIKGLIDKNILKSETELSNVGALPARVLELYKQSRTHLIINYLHIGLIGNQEAVVIIPLKNARNEREYELLRMPRVAILYSLLKEHSVLCRKATEIEKSICMKKHEVFLHQISSYDGNIMVGVFQDEQIVTEHVYYWKGDEMLRYDLNLQVEKKVNATHVRREFLKLLQIEGEVKKHAG